MRVRSLWSAVLLAITCLSLSGCMLAYPFTWTLAHRESVLGAPPEPPNPTTWTFDTPLEETAATFIALTGYPWMEWRPIGSSPDELLHVRGSERSWRLPFAGRSTVYHGESRLLTFNGELVVTMLAVGEARTEVTVENRGMYLVVGQWWTGFPHSGFEGIHRDVAATSVEEYALLHLLGEYLGARDMPEIRLPEDGLAAVLDALRDPEDRDAMYAADALRLTRPSQACDQLAKLALDETVDGRTARDAADALAQIGHPASIPTLVEILRGDPFRNSVAEALGRFDRRAKVAVPLLRAMADESTFHERVALRSLGRIAPGDPDVRALLVERLEDPLVRLEAACGLAYDAGRLPTALPVLIEALEDPERDPHHKWRIAMILRDIGPPAAAAIPALESLERTGDGAGVRAAATTALLHIWGGP